MTDVAGKDEGLAARTHGDAGPHVVFVHGLFGQGKNWTTIAKGLADGHRVTLLDLPNHGHSPWTDRVDYVDMAEMVAAELESYGEPVTLVGHSMGGDAIVYAASSFGRRVRGLVWVDAFRSLGNESHSPPEEVETFLAPFREDFGAAVERFVRSMFAETADRDLVDRIAAGMAAAPPEVALGCLRYARNREPPILAALPHIAAPIVAINPDIGPTDVDSMRRHGVEPIVLEDVGHFLMIEAPDQFNPVLAATLASFGN